MPSSLRRYQIMLSPEVVEVVRNLSGGNMSKGVEELLWSHPEVAKRAKRLKITQPERTTVGRPRKETEAE